MKTIYVIIFTLLTACSGESGTYDPYNIGSHSNEREIEVFVGTYYDIQSVYKDLYIRDSRYECIDSKVYKKHIQYTLEGITNLDKLYIPENEYDILQHPYVQQLYHVDCFYTLEIVTWRRYVAASYYDIADIDSLPFMNGQ